MKLSKEESIRSVSLWVSYEKEYVTHFQSGLQDYSSREKVMGNVGPDSYSQISITRQQRLLSMTTYDLPL